jgi:hypothetical protein
MTGDVMFLTELLTLLSNKILLITQCVVFIILNGLDAHSTWLVLKPNNYHRERNPIARWVFRQLKIPGAIIFYKAIVLGFLCVFISNWWKEALTINVALLIGNLLFIFVVLHNYKVYRNYRNLRKHKVAKTTEIAE